MQHKIFDRNRIPLWIDYAKISCVWVTRICIRNNERRNKIIVRFGVSKRNVLMDCNIISLRNETRYDPQVNLNTKHVLFKSIICLSAIPRIFSHFFQNWCNKIFPATSGKKILAALLVVVHHTWWSLVFNRKRGPVGAQGLRPPPRRWGVQPSRRRVYSQLVRP